MMDLKRRASSTPKKELKRRRPVDTNPSPSDPYYHEKMAVYLFGKSSEGAQVEQDLSQDDSEDLYDDEVAPYDANESLYDEYEDNFGHSNSGSDDDESEREDKQDNLLTNTPQSEIQQRIGFFIFLLSCERWCTLKTT